MSWEQKSLRCFDCKFWWPTAEAAGSEPTRERSILGLCRRHAPPTQVLELPERAKRYPAWVTTKREDWCGDHMHREV